MLQGVAIEEHGARDLHRFGPPEGKDLRLAFACIDFGGITMAKISSSRHRDVSMGCIIA
jgi:hypothetical protein